MLIVSFRIRKGPFVGVIFYLLINLFAFYCVLFFLKTFSVSLFVNSILQHCAQLNSMNVLVA